MSITSVEKHNVLKLTSLTDTETQKKQASCRCARFCPNLNDPTFVSLKDCFISALKVHSPKSKIICMYLFILSLGLAI